MKTGALVGSELSTPDYTHSNSPNITATAASAAAFTLGGSSSNARSPLLGEAFKLRPNSAATNRSRTVGRGGVGSNELPGAQASSTSLTTSTVGGPSEQGGQDPAVAALGGNNSGGGRRSTECRSETSTTIHQRLFGSTAGCNGIGGGGTGGPEYHFGRRPAIVEKRAHKFLRAMSKAMRYYRIWIYACNVALLIGAIIYATAFLAIATDSRLNFFTNFIRLWHPSFLYSYVAFVAQAGVLQVVGCIGAVKLNERYLHIYLLSLFALLAGDAIVGVVWLLRYNSIVANMPSDLRNQIQVEYANNTAIQNLWNDFQASAQCCGVTGPSDWNTSTWTLSQDLGQWDPETEELLPPSCCHPSDSLFGPPHSVCIVRKNNEHVNRNGCEREILNWLQSSTDLLSVLGFCISTFTKMCFLCLLRYEIREMIDKIRVIKGQNGSSGGSCSGGPGGPASHSGSMGHVLPFQDLEIYLPRQSMQTEPLLGGAVMGANASGSGSGAGGGGGGVGGGGSTTTGPGGSGTQSGGSGLTGTVTTGGGGGRSTIVSSTGPSEKFHCRIGALAFPGHALSGSRTLMSSVSSSNIAGGDRSKKSSLV